jgi:type VI secretion system Hcp family effector
MASDAFMELSDPETWGESTDAQFGMEGRAKGAFEISTFKFGVEERGDDDDDDDDDSKHKGAKKSQKASKHKGKTAKSFTITKPIDKGSLDLFLACLENTKMDWANVFLREQGDKSQQPWLWLEFTGVRVETFDWDMTAGAAGDEAKSQESVKFQFETILIKYSRQDSSGQHKAVKIKGWNALHNNREHHERERIDGVVRDRTWDSD